MSEIFLRLVYLIYCFVCLFCLCFYYYKNLFFFLSKPLLLYLNLNTLIYTNLLDLFFLYIKISFLFSFIFTIPFIIYNLYFYFNSGFFKKNNKIYIYILYILLN